MCFIVICVIVMIHRLTCATNFVCVRFAFAEFESVDDAKKAVESINGKTFEGRQIRVDFAHEKGSGEKSA